MCLNSISLLSGGQANIMRAKEPITGHATSMNYQVSSLGPAVSNKDTPITQEIPRI